MIRLTELNALPAGGFVEALGGIFEHSPWVAERVAGERPFGSVVQLTARMRAAVDAATPAQQRALIRAHPKLGARGPQLATLTSASQGEQRRAGLAALSDAQFAELLELNERYVARFGFPFILAVRGHDPASIIATCRQRLDRPEDEEQRTALTQIGLIAGYRLADTVRSEPAIEVRAMAAALQGAGAATAERLREWMLGAHLDVAAGPTGEPVGTLAVDASATGLPGNAVTLASTAAVLIGIAVVRDLRNRGQAATRALVLDPLSGQAGPEPWTVDGDLEQVQYLSSLLTSSGIPADEHR